MAAPQVLTREDCEAVARRHFGREDVRVARWTESKLGGDKPAGFLGAHKLVTVHAAAGNGPEESVDVFLKTVPDNENQTKLIETTGAFRKEVFFYQHLVPAWEEFGIIPKASLAQRIASAEVPSEPSWGCRCYIARDKLVVLENIAKLGYTSESPRDVYDREHILFCMKMIAKFHAASLIYEEKLSEGRKKPFRIGEEFPEMVQETFYLVQDGHPGEQTTEAGVVGLMECAKKLPACQDPCVLRVVEERLPGVLRRVYDSVKASARRRNVLCHSDLWQNNILFRRDARGRPVDVALVDFQLMRYAPPAHDVYDLLHLTTRRELRERHEREFLDVYYATLADTLREFGLSAEHVLPREEFDASLDEQRLAGRLAAVFCLHFILSSEEMIRSVFSDSEEYERTVSEGKYRAKLICTQFDRDQEYRERLEECLMEVLEKDVL
ncbi:Uncharacterized protein GBIM_11769 [Gryllus bimaculatus]|nr:Uncharacterized protein GBIM_11769 [Gryllus bimaculatus]